MSSKVLGMHHIGITVPNLKEAVAFFELVFDAVPVFSTGPFDVEESFMTRRLGTPAHTRIKDLVFLRCGDGTSLELFEYSGEDSTARPKRNSEIGGAHIAIEVEDTHTTVDRLKAKGIEFLDGPNVVTEGPLAGLTWIYFNAPWGQSLEFVSFKNLGYEKDTSHRIWSAKD
jgi:catechol 2,3-dioxygenase-like lactoylglutathione lyase family enzyme